MLRAYAHTEDYASPNRIILTYVKEDYPIHKTTCYYDSSRVYRDGRKCRVGYYYSNCPSSTPTNGQYERILYYCWYDYVAPFYDIYNNKAYYSEDGTENITRIPLCSY